MNYAKKIGQTLAETVEELVIMDELQLDEIRDPALLKAEIKRLGTSAHPSASARMDRLQRLHDRKLASVEAQQARQVSNETKMHGIAKKFGYKGVKGQQGKFMRDGHTLTIGPGNKWSHRRAGNKRSTIGKTPIRTLVKHLKSLHEEVSFDLDTFLNEGAFSVSNTGSGWAVTSGPRGAKRLVAGPFPSKYSASQRKMQMLARIAGGGGAAPAPMRRPMGENEEPRLSGDAECPHCEKMIHKGETCPCWQSGHSGNGEPFVNEATKPLHTTQDIHNTLLSAGWVYKLNESKQDKTYDHYENPRHGQVMVDKKGNYKAPRVVVEADGYNHPLDDGNYNPNTKRMRFTYSPKGKSVNDVRDAKVQVHPHHIAAAKKIADAAHKAVRAHYDANNGAGDKETWNKLVATKQRAHARHKALVDKHAAQNAK
jgi:hypothetical protein